MTGTLSGVVVVDKPVGPTSFDIVREARRATGVRRIGHGGTLDPLASGVLPICFGEATKLAQFLLDADKEYEATFRFGVETDSHDATGKVTAERPVEHLTAAAVAAALGGFVGPQRQVPPLHAALKHRGRRLYSYARAGETVERAPRPVTVYAFDLLAFERPSAARLRIRCSKGTYVRALARDVGRAVGTGAHVSALRRTRSGPFHLGQAILPEALGDPGLPLISPAEALSDLPAAQATAEVARALAQGKPVPWEAVGGPPPGIGPVRILWPDGALLAVARPAGPDGGRIATIRVFVRDVSD
jgi:tRNA pseudouridine55 synthase